MFGPPKKPSRLGQWDGRRRSSRSDEPVLPHLWQRTVLLRLGAVLVTALSATSLAYNWGPPQSFRVGEICPHDLRARVYFEVVNETQTNQKRDQAVECLPPEQRSDPQAREEAARAVPPVIVRYPPGTLLVQCGHSISDEQYTLLQSETHAFL